MNNCHSYYIIPIYYVLIQPICQSALITVQKLHNVLLELNDYKIYNDIK